jgi:hypothetical protein
MIKEIKNKEFLNGIVYALETEDSFLIETTDTFLPSYTKDAIKEKQNTLRDANTGSRKERWMIGVSTMSSCPVHCKFCATGNMKKYRNLTAEEILAQVEFVLSKREERFVDAFEHKIKATPKLQRSAERIFERIWNYNVIVIASLAKQSRTTLHCTGLPRSQSSLAMTHNIYEQNERHRSCWRDGDKIVSSHGDNLETTFARLQPPDDFLSSQYAHQGRDKRNSYHYIA